MPLRESTDLSTPREQERLKQGEPCVVPSPLPHLCPPRETRLGQFARMRLVRAHVHSQVFTVVHAVPAAADFFTLPWGGIQKPYEYSCSRRTFCAMASFLPPCSSMASNFRDPDAVFRGRCFV